MRLTAPRRRPPAASEHNIHVGVAKALYAACTPGWNWNHIPSGELRDPAIGGKLKGMGHRPGWPDFILLDPRVVPYFLELKNGKAPLSDPQEAFRDWCLPRGGNWAVARALDEALEQLQRWGALDRLRVSA